MKANELTYGDWVLIDGVARKVCAITKHKVGYHRTELPFGDCKLSYTRLHEVNTIPLTPEILERNGFDPETFLTTEWEEKVYFKEFPGCAVVSDGVEKYTFGTTCYWNERDVDGSPIDWGTRYKSRIEGLRYVHELQHALRLCELDKLADNFKI